MKKNLVWLEYGEGTFFFKEPFESIGFQVRSSGWGPRTPNAGRIHILPEMKIWRPDLIFMMPVIAWGHEDFFDVGLAEWMEIHQLIKQDSDLHRAKIIVLVNREMLPVEQETAWQRTCDRLLYLPFQCVAYPKIAMQLLGEEVGLAGVNNYLAHNGQWTVRDLASADANQVLPDAQGVFARPPLTRVLTAPSPNELSWLPSLIQAEQPTNLVYMIKSPEEWRNGLHESEFRRLSTLARSVTSQHQLLVGVNISLLQIEPEHVANVIRQLQQAGDWKLFVTEHLWVEWMLPPHFFYEVAYNQENSKVKDTFVL